MAEYLHFVCVSHGEKLLTKSSAIKEAQKGTFAFQQPLTLVSCYSNGYCTLMVLTQMSNPNSARNKQCR